MKEFDATDPVQVEGARKRLETDLFRMAQAIAQCGLVPTITLAPLPTGMGEYNVIVEVRYGKAFYRDPKFSEFITNHVKLGDD